MTNQVNILNDVATLTKLPNKALAELTNKEILCIGGAIHDAIQAKEEVAVLNIGIGSLSIELSTMQCKFIPSKELKAMIKRSLTNKADPIEYCLEQSIVNKLMALCDNNL